MRERSNAPAAVLVDLDGTLVDSEPVWWEAQNEVMSSWGSSWTTPDHTYCLGGPLERVSGYMADRIGAPRSGRGGRTTTVVGGGDEDALTATTLATRGGEFPPCLPAIRDSHGSGYRLHGGSWLMRPSSAFALTSAEHPSTS